MSWLSRTGGARASSTVVSFSVAFSSLGVIGVSVEWSWSNVGEGLAGPMLVERSAAIASLLGGESPNGSGGGGENGSELESGAPSRKRSRGRRGGRGRSRAKQGSSDE